MEQFKIGDWVVDYSHIYYAQVIDVSEYIHNNRIVSSKEFYLRFLDKSEGVHFKECFTLSSYEEVVLKQLEK